MIYDLVATSTVAKGDPGSYLLGVSYLLWPNSALHNASKGTSRWARGFGFLVVRAVG